MEKAGGWTNVFIERLWKSAKHEDIYLKAYSSMAKVKSGLASYLKFYNLKR
jgi:putative transposase